MGSFLIKGTLVCSFALMVLSTTAAAQNCSPESLFNIPGKWIAGTKGSVNGISPAELAKEKSATGAIHLLISQNYSPMGLNASYSEQHGYDPAAGKNWAANPFGYNLYFLKFRCKTGPGAKLPYHVSSDTPTTLHIGVNTTLDSFHGLYAAELPDDNVGIYKEWKADLQISDGLVYWVENPDFSDPSVKEYHWMVTYKGKLPFLFVSRREYLYLKKVDLDRQLRETESSGIAPQTRRTFNESFSLIDNWLKRPASELDRPAIIDKNDGQWRFSGFLEAGVSGAYYSIKPNLDYYDRKLPKTTPQFYTINFKVRQGELAYDKAFVDVKRALDFDKLRQMLGK